MSNVKVTNIQEYMARLDPKSKEVIEKLRNLIKKTIPESEEKILWSTPWYYLNKKPFAYIANNKNHVNFGFAFGSHLDSEFLEGTGKNMRHIKIKKVSKWFPKEKFESLLKYAVTLK